MQRTSLVLPDGVRLRATQRARLEGVSFGEFVRRALERALDDPNPSVMWIAKPEPSEEDELTAIGEES